MRTLRKCTAAQLNTGVSKCAPEMSKMLGAILVEPGMKIKPGITLDELEEMVHADRPNRIYGIATFVEYAKDGGEPQTSAEGYGPEQVTGFSARKDTFTLDKYRPELMASLTRCRNKEWDAYFFDKDKYLHGLQVDGELYGFPMSGVYATATPFPTSSAKAGMTITFAHKDAEQSFTDYDYAPMTINPTRATLGLVAVKLEKTTESGTKYKIFEAMGGNDLTPIYGPLIADASATVVKGSTAVTYNDDEETLTITATGDVRLAAPSVLYANDIKGIEQV